ncbi:MAG TPA: hypothetical protein VN636_08370 [Acidimicrobiia bacterium]|nr:hypothetical protein [Acidimicrobiia bacterium]
MFDLDVFLSDCVAARHEADPHLAIKEVVARAVANPSALLAALPPERAAIKRLHVSDDLTVLNVVWAPGMRFGPHDHRMFAVIGIFSGGEDNTFFRRDGDSLVEAGGRSLAPTDACLLGSDGIHAVTNPTSEYAGALHVYGGDFFTTARSEWRGDPYREEPYDVARTLAHFEAANTDPTAR